MVKVKVCGITNPGDARFAVEAGADALGLVFAESPRQVSVEQAREVVAAL
ncbi:MAG: N-(5'-phosphoribosyl)anthranilate isomerase, partial [Actinomycetota bacterium]|nr:N-(5'-phosphoribosyl)anthranilate isomerase [Actinomycetota bacterium]